MASAPICPQRCAARFQEKELQPTRERKPNDEIALFPQEWRRNPLSPFLRGSAHDLPHEEPELMRFYGYGFPKLRRGDRVRVIDPAASKRRGGGEGAIDGGGRAALVGGCVLIVRGLMGGANIQFFRG